MILTPDSIGLGKPALGVVDELDVQRALATVSRSLLGRGTEPARAGRFVLEQRLGAGGMGVVYSAFDPKLSRKVAIKLLHPEVGGGPGTDRLLQEAQTLASLSHPNVVTVHDVGTCEDRLFLAMELVEGQSLAEWIGEPRSWPEVVRVLAEAGRGLVAAHEAGIVHRDFKPANVILGSDGRVVVLDFGLADRARAPTSTESSGAAGGRDQDLAVPGVVIGTPAYMAPEQHRGELATAASDQFAFCVSLFEAIHGRLPFGAGRSRIALLEAIESGRIAREAGGRRAPRWLGQAIERGLRAEPSARWPSMQALLERLRRGLEPSWQRWALPSVIVVATGALVGARMVGAEASCEELGAAIDRVWSPEAAREVSGALGALEHPNAATTPARVVEALDEYAAAWSDTWVEACEAQRKGLDPAAVARSTRCLDGQRAWVSSTVDLLRAPDTVVLLDAPDLVPRVTDLEPCRLVAESPRSGSPATDELRAEVERVSGEALAWGRAGKHELSIRTAEEVLARAEAAGDEGPIARAQGLLGALHRLAGDHERALERFEAAVVWAERSGDTPARLDAMRGLCLELIEAARHDEAERLLDQVRAAHLRFDPRPWHWDAQLSILYAELALRRELGDEAVEHAELGLAMVLEHAPDDPHWRLEAEMVLARALTLQGRLDDALGRWQEMKTVAERLYGPAHDRVADVWGSLAVIHHRRGEAEQAVEALARSLAIRERLHGPQHPDLIRPLINLGVMQVGRDPLAAQSTFERAVAIAAKHRATHGRQLASARHKLAGVLKMVGRSHEAIDQLWLAHELDRELDGPGHPRTIRDLYDVAEALIVVEDLDAAEGAFEQALALERAERGASSPGSIAGLNGLAKVLDLRGRPEQARAHAELAVRLAHEHDSPPDVVVSVHHTLLVLLLADGRPEALDRARTVLQATETLLDDPRVAAAARDKLARRREELEAALGRPHRDDASG